METYPSLPHNSLISLKRILATHLLAPWAYQLLALPEPHPPLLDSSAILPPEAGSCWIL
jgi:hypothetical protein